MNVETDVFTVDWEEVKGASSYVVEITPEIGAKYIRITERTEWTEKGTKPGKWFKINIQSRDDKNRGNGVATDMLELQTICLRPSNVKMSEIGTTFVKFGWNEMEGADFYVVTIIWSVKDELVNRFGSQEIPEAETVVWEGESGIKKDGLKASKLEQFKINPSEVAVKDKRAWFQFQTRTNSIEIVGLDSATQYSFQFETVNQQGKVSHGKVYMNETTVPEKVGTVTLLGVTDSSAMFTWDAVEGIEHYIINVTSQSNGRVKTFKSKSSMITLKELAPGSWFNVEIFTVGSDGNMNYEGSEELSFQTVPSPPTNFEITNVSTTTMDLSWDESEGASYYKIIIRLTEPFRVVHRVVEVRTNSHTVEKLSPGTKYLFTVVSVSTGGRESTSSRLILETTTPAKPSDLRLIDISSTTANLQWQYIEGAFKYVVSIRGDDKTSSEVETKGTVISIDNLTPGVWYEFWVKSVGSNGKVNQKESNIIRKQTVPESPDPIKIEEVTTTTIALSWKKVHGIKQYRLFVEEAGDTTGNTLRVFNVTRSFFTLSQLTPGMTYSISAIAVGTSGVSSVKSDTVQKATVPGSIGELNVTDVSTSHVGLKWTPITGASMYTLLMRLPGSGKIVKSLDTKKSSLVVTSLQPGSTYIFSVTVIGKDRKKSGESPEIQVQTTPLSPTGVKSEKVTTTAIDLSWNKVRGVKLYKVIVREQGSGSIWRTDEVQKTQHSVVQLTPGKTYVLRVVSVATSGRESTAAAAVTETTFPEKPTGLQFIDIKSTSMSLKWDEVIGAEQYTIYVQGDDKTNRELTSTEAEVTIKALSPGQFYKVFVLAVGRKKRQSKQSDKLREQTAPLSPSKLLMTKTGTTFISFQWEPVSGAKFYEVTIHGQTGPTESGKQTSQTFISDDTDYTVNQLVPGVAYTITVVGVGTSGRKSRPSQELKQTTVPAALDDVIVEDATATSVTLRWSGVTGASSYTIVVRSASDRSNTVLRTVDTTKTTFTVPALVPGDLYFFSIRSKGFGGKLSKESPRVEAQTVPLQPSDVEVTEVGTTTMSLKWKSVNGAGFYRVSTKPKQGDKTKTDDVRETEHKVEGLNPGVEYVITISAVGTSGREGKASSPVKQVTKPSGPTGVTLSNVRTNSITVKWNEVTGARNYKVIVQEKGKVDVEEYDTLTNSHFLTELQPGTEYSVSVSSVGYDGQESAPSGQVSEQTMPNPPNMLRIIDTTETSISFRWEDVRGAIGYVVVMTEVLFVTETRIETISNKITVKDLSPGTEYEFRVLSVGKKDRINTVPSRMLIEQTVSSPVQGVQIMSVTPKTVLLGWSRSPGVARYVIKVRDHSTGVLVERFDVIAKQQLVEDLQPGKNYSFTVTSIANNGKESDESEPAVVSTKLSTPAKPVARTVTNSSATLRWKEVEGAREYIVIVRDVEQATQTRITVEEEFIVVEELVPGTTYSFSIIAVGESGKQSEKGPTTTLHTIPQIPRIKKVDSIATDYLSISWDGVKGATRYVIYARWKRPGVRQPRVINATTTMTSYKFKVPLPGVKYDITVEAEGKGGKSQESAILEESSLPEAPPTPKTDEVSTTSANMKWEPVPGAASYEVQILDESTGKEETLVVYKAEVQLKGLDAGNWYSIKVFSRDSKGRMNKEGSSAFRIQTVPSPPARMQIEKVTMDSVSVTWRKVVGAENYVLTVTADESEVVEFAKSWQNVEMSNGQVSFRITTDKNMATVDGLKSGSQFRFEVQAIGAQGGKSESISMEATTLPAIVEDVLVSKISTTSATIRWTDVKGASFYRVRVRNRQKPIVQNVQQPVATMTGLIAGTWYNVSVTTFDILNRTSGVQSENVQFQTVPRKITDFESSETTINSMKISWKSVKGAKSYELKLLWIADEVSSGHLKGEAPQDRDGLTFKTFKSPLTQIKLSQLDPGTTYWYEITSFSEEGRRSLPSNRANETTLPDGITEINIDAVTNTLISLSWEPIKGAGSYAILISNMKAAGSPMRRQTKRPEIIVDNLNPGVAYEFVIRPRGVKGNQDEVETSSIRVKTIPLPPSSIKVDSVSQTSIDISWTPSRGATRYGILAEYKDMNRRLRTLEFESTTPDFRIRDLQSGISYVLQVVAYGNRNEASKSERSPAIVQRTKLAAPANLTLDDFAEDYVALSWEPTTGATAYTVYVRDVEKDDITPIDLENELFTDVTNLEPGVLYSFSVRGINRKDDMMSEHSNIVQQRTVPSAPQFVTVIEVGADFIDVKWDPVVGADFYTIFLAEKGEAEEMIPDYLFTSAMLSDLKPGTEYRIQIMATSVEGYESRRSDRLTQATAPNAPGTPTVKSFNTNSIELEWERMQGATSYIITMTDEQTKEKSEIDAGSTLTFLISDLSPGSVYSFTIRGEDQDKGLTSDESGSITQGTYPETPNVQVISFSPDRISLSWNKIEGAHSYTLYVKEVDGSKGEQEIEKLKATKYTIDELKSGSEYEIQVVAITEGGLRSDRSVRVIQFTSPNSPSGLAAVNVTQNAFTVTWIPAAGATSYTLVLTNIETSEKTRVDVEGVLEYRFNKLKAGTMFSIYAFALTLPDNTRSDRSETIEQRTLPLAPKKVVIFDVKESSISLEWKKVKGAKTYTVFVNRVGDAQGLERQVKDIATPLVTVDRLSPGTLYQFEVASVTEDRLAGKRSDQVQQQTVPAPPQDIVISEVTSTSFRVNWTKSEGATSYSLKVVNEDTKQERIKSVGNTVTTKFIRLVPGSLYRITVNAQRKDADVTSRNSYRVMQRTLPLAPTNLRVTSRFSDAVSLEWDDTKGAASFHIYIYELNEDGTPKGDELFIDGILDLTVEIIDLDPGSLYEFEVVSVTEEGETSEDGALISERTRYAAPIMPQSTKPLVRLSKVGSSTATAEWDAIQFAFEYRLLAVSDDAANVAVDFINGTTAVIEGLSANTEYLVTLVAIGRSGDQTEESSPPAILNTLPLPPSKPSGLEATGLTKDSILLTWEPSPRAQSYEIEKVDPVTKNKQVIGKILEPQWEIKDLRPGKIYVFRVTAVGRFEKSELSDEIRTGSTHPIPQMPYTGVELIQASNIRWNGFTLTLQRIPDAVTYTIIMRTGGEIFREINNIRFTRYPVGNLTEMTTYEVTYVGVGAGGEESDESDPSLFATTLANTPEIPKGVGASDMTAESVVVEWDDADRAVSYDVIITELLTSIPTFFQDVSSPFIATGLVFDTRYAVAVVSVGNFDRSRPSGQVRFKTKIPKPGDVRVIRTRFVEKNAIGLLWSPAIYAVSYTISVSLNGKQVQTHKEILGNSIRIENLKPDKNYKVGVKPIGLEKDEGNEQYIYVTTLPTSGSDEDYDENINEFGIDESTLDDDEPEEQPGDPGKLTSPRSPKPDSLEDALSKLISDMMDLPDDEITKSSSGKEIIKESSIFRNRIWRTVESIRRFVMGQTLFQLAERKSDLSILQQRNSKEVSDQMDKLIILSRHIRDDGKELGRSGAKKFAMEIAGILSTIFLQTPETEGISAADKEDIQEEMAPILEDLLLEVILGEFEVKISLVQARNIALTWSGKIPTDEIVFKIREVDSDTFLESITVDKDTPDVKFQKLSPNTNYEIFVATSDDTRILYSEETTTKQGLFVVPPPPPIALRIQFAARSYITVRWKKVVKENTEITYIVRLYRPNGKKVIERFKMQKATSLNITKLKRKTSYDVTVSSYDIGAKKQSKESPRLRIRTK
uniref:titin-like n=1 Tax=Styela clava TaxID=7725 RepID=UPI001939F8C6|nr:titin-like [Styela clava]